MQMHILVLLVNLLGFEIFFYFKQNIVFFLMVIILFIVFTKQQLSFF